MADLRTRTASADLRTCSDAATDARPVIHDLTVASLRTATTAGGPGQKHPAFERLLGLGRVVRRELTELYEDTAWDAGTHNPLVRLSRSTGRTRASLTSTRL